MGKRKSSKKPQTRAKTAPLDKSFKCLFCQHNGTINCKLDNKTKVGRLDCKDCGQHFETDINHLTEAIDIYAEWIDACRAVNSESSTLNVRGGARPSSGPAPKRRAQNELNDDDDDDDGDLPEPIGRKKARREQVDEDGSAGDDNEDLPEPIGLKKRQEVVPEEDEDEDDLPAPEESTGKKRKAAVSDDEEN